MSASWKVTLSCTRAEAEAIDAGPELALDPVPTLATSEMVLDDAEAWRLIAATLVVLGRGARGHTRRHPPFGANGSALR